MAIANWLRDKKYGVRIDKPFSGWKTVNGRTSGSGIDAPEGPG